MRRLQFVKSYLVRAPFSVAIGLLMVLCGVLFGTRWRHLHDLLAAGPVTTIERHFWWTPVTALIVPGSLFAAIAGVLLAVTLMAYVESLIGTLRTMLCFFGLGALAVMVGVGLHMLTIWLNSPLWLLAVPELTLDPTIGVVATIMTGSAFAPTLFRRRIRIVGFAILVIFALYGGHQDSMYRLIAGLLGLLFGRLLFSLSPRRGEAPVPGAWRRGSFTEIRTLVAAVVAATGLGPIVVVVTHSAYGPLALLAAGIVRLERSVALGGCATYFTSSCSGIVVESVARGVGPVLLSLVPVALSLIAAWGLRTGRRAAWLLAMLVNTMTLVVTTIAVATVSTLDLSELERIGERLAVAALLALGVPIAVLVMLVLTRRRFQIRGSRQMARRLAAAVLVALVVVIGAGGLITVTGDVVRWPLGFRLWLFESLHLFVPPGYARLLLPTSGYPHGGFSLLNQWVGMLFWLVVMIGTIGLFRSAERSGLAPEAARFRELLREIGGGTLGFLGTWGGTEHWIAEAAGSAGDAGDRAGERQAEGRPVAVAYRVIGGVALAIADPVCAPGDEAAAVNGFLAHCDREGWTPVFYGIHAPGLRALAARGWQSVAVGEETVVHLPGLELVGGSWKRVRYALAKAEREGLTVARTRWQDLHPAMAAQIEALSEEWVAEKALPELGFTLGRLEELRDPDVELLLAVGPDGELQAVTSWLPVWQDGVLVGRTLDFMRRSEVAMAEVMVFLIATAALQMRDAGLEVMSLSGAPLTTGPACAGKPVPPATLLTRLLGWLADVLEPVYGFDSLFQFKMKFKPELATIYLAYEDAASLPAAAQAITRAYLPEASGRQLLTLLHTLAA